MILFAVVMPPACAFCTLASRILSEASTRASGWIGALRSAPRGIRRYGYGY